MPPVTLLVPNPRAQTNFACVGFDAIAKVIVDLAQLEEGNAHFCTSFHALKTGEEAGLKKVVLPASELSAYRKRLQGFEPRTDCLSRDQWCLVLCPTPSQCLITYKPLSEPAKSPRRERLDRKISAKSVL
jgi:hypothetical protein